MMFKTLAVAALTLSLTACGTKTISGHDLGLQVKIHYLNIAIDGAATGFGAVYGSLDSVECPDSIEQKRGETTECHMNWKDGRTSDVTVTMTDDSGGYALAEH
ncbi:DUF4333 domain-containing protein [Nocardioides montaniterrae]